MVTLYDKYGIPTGGAPEKTASADGDTYSGLTPQQVEAMRDRFEQFAPGLASRMAEKNRRNLFTDVLPPGANWAEGKRTAQSTNVKGGPGGMMTTVQTPYQPEFASPDRQQYPVHRILANRYWRMFYKMDPVIGNCVEMYADLPWSNFELTGDGVEGEVRQAYEQMCRETQLLAMLPYFVKEYLVVGEAVPHTFFDNSKGMFTHIAMHNPDQLEVIDAPFIKMDPVVEFIPDDKLRSVLTSNSPALMDIREKMPPELLTRLNARQNIPLSPLNVTFIPRKLHPYDTRGTSILSRMWRVLMLEDAIFNATIQTARRHAAPLKVAKLGNPATGWIPPPEQERRLLELLSQAELDPNAWLVYHYGIQFEAVGTTERAMSISREWEVIERIKLVALGISRSFLHGEVSYASSATGLQVFLQRLKAMRLFFEQKWLYPKFFKPIAQINGWIKPKPAEVAHRFRVKRSARELEEQNAYIVPRIVWDKSLDPQINMDLINAMNALESLGVKFSKTTKMATAGFSFEEETKKIHRENEYEKAYLPKVEDQGGPQGPGGGPGGAPPPGGAPKLAPSAPKGPPSGPKGPAPSDSAPKPPGGPPGGPPGPPPPGGAPPGGMGAPPPSPAGAAKGEEDERKDFRELSQAKPTKSSRESLKSKIWVDDKHGNWEADEIENIISLVTDLDSDNPFWTQLALSKDFKRAVVNRDMESAWSMIKSHLEDNNYPDKDIDELQYILEQERVLMPSDSVKRLMELEASMLPENQEFASSVARVLKDKSNKITADDTAFLIGVGDVSL